MWNEYGIWKLWIKCVRWLQDHWITWKPVFKILQINCLEDCELIRLNQLFNSLPNEKNDQDFHLYWSNCLWSYHNRTNLQNLGFTESDMIHIHLFPRLLIPWTATSFQESLMNIILMSDVTLVGLWSFHRQNNLLKTMLQWKKFISFCTLVYPFPSNFTPLREWPVDTILMSDVI